MAFDFLIIRKEVERMGKQSCGLGILVDVILALFGFERRLFSTLVFLEIYPLFVGFR